MSEPTALAPDGKPHAGHPELWRGASTLPETKGLLADLKMWEEAESHLESMLELADHQPNPAVILALTDSYNRLVEERRRAEELLGLREKWARRPIGSGRAGP